MSEGITIVALPDLSEPLFPTKEKKQLPMLSHHTMREEDEVKDFWSRPTFQKFT